MVPYTMNLMVQRYCHLGEIIIYDNHLAMYKHSLDVIFYVVGPTSENELMLNAGLIAFSDALSMLLRNQVEKRALLENLDLVLLCLDETIDDGYVHRQSVDLFLLCPGMF
jgi:coatomer subunit zeta